MDQLLPSSSDISNQIQQITQYIKNGDRDAAKRMVADLIKSDPNNADVWYLYAFLVDDAAKKKSALDKALSIDPEHVQARQLSEKLRTDGLVSDLFAPTPSAQLPPAYGGQGAQAYQPPPIIVNVNQDNHANVSATAIANGGVKAKKVNDIAFIIGFVFAIFGIFGLSHLITGKIGGAIVYFIGGFVWAFVAVLIISLTAGLGACVALPLHIYIAYSWSKRGATIEA